MLSLLNYTRMTAGFTVGMRADARQVLVVVVKGTYAIPQKGNDVMLLDQQLPLVDADAFSGEPGFSAPILEVDYAPFKPRCDVLLNGSAYAPDNRPAQRVPVALRVGAMAKTFHVVGPRVWTRGLANFTPSEPEYFVKLPVNYDFAFGGIDTTYPDKPRYFALNHAGKGFSYHMNLDLLVRQPLPYTEEIDNPISNPRGSYHPMAFGPIGRSWEPRCRFAGTYDQNWVENVCPFLPADFKDDYYQAAPPDQQIPYLTGGEEVALLNLTPQGRCTFKLPRINLPMLIQLRGDDNEEGHPLTPVIDTVLLEPDESRFSLVWRASWPLKQDLFEIETVIVGEIPRAVKLSMELGKPYYRSLGEYIESLEPEVS